MSDPIQPQAPAHDVLDETLARLSKKPGVKATLVIDRTNGAVMKTSGNISALQPAASKSAPAVSATPATPASPSPNAAAATFAIPSAQDVELQGAVQYAALVSGFVKAAGGLVDDLGDEDELKLLRLRTKRQELVIVPDAKYLLVLVHDTPTA